jgi:hypothetical protein
VIVYSSVNVKSSNFVINMGGEKKAYLGGFCLEWFWVRKVASQHERRLEDLLRLGRLKSSYEFVLMLIRALKIQIRLSKVKMKNSAQVNASNLNISVTERRSNSSSKIIVAKKVGKKLKTYLLWKTFVKKILRALIGCKYPIGID